MKKRSWVAGLCALGLSVADAHDSPKPTALEETVGNVSSNRSRECSDPTCSPPSSLTSGSATNYCQSSLNSFGTYALMSHVGSLALINNTFGLMVTGAPPIPNSLGRFTYGRQPCDVPYGNGYLCIRPLLGMMPAQHLGNGTVVRTMTAHPADFSPFTPGSTWDFQFWYRDAGQPPARFNLSDGLNVVFAP